MVHVRFGIASLIVTITVAVLIPLTIPVRDEENEDPEVIWSSISDSNITNGLNSSEIHKPPSALYDIDWYSDNYTDPFEFSRSALGLCPLCKFKVRNYKANSTPRDVLLTFVIGDVVGVLPFIRSLRTTGSSCTVFLFTDSVAREKMTQDEISVLENCSVNIINTGNYSRMSTTEIAFLRYPIFYDFLYTRRHLIDRVIAVDLYDTVFQGDPFTEDLDKNVLYFVSENATVAECYLSSIWLKQTSEEVYEKLKNKHILTAGVLIGGIVPMLQFLDTYHNATRPPKAPDQGYFVYMAYEFMNESTNVMTRICDEKDGVIVLHYFNEVKRNFVFGDFKSSSSPMYPMIIHQYDKLPVLAKSVANSCPKGKLKTSQYIRQLPDDEPQEVENNENG